MSALQEILIFFSSSLSFAPLFFSYKSRICVFHSTKQEKKGKEIVCLWCHYDIDVALYGACSMRKNIRSLVATKMSENVVSLKSIRFFYLCNTITGFTCAIDPSWLPYAVGMNYSNWKKFKYLKSFKWNGTMPCLLFVFTFCSTCKFWNQRQERDFSKEYHGRKKDLWKWNWYINYIFFSKMPSVLLQHFITDRESHFGCMTLHWSIV